MGLTSLQVCMDTSDWLQGGVNEEGGMDSSASSGDILTCSRPMLERRLRPQQDQALKCPRCDSTHTKFCYYNNYSLSQPRYFCKTCRRYWTKGGSLRNIPVGGGCRKNKRSSVGGVKKSSTTSSSHNATDLHLSFPELQLPHFTTFLGDHNGDLGSQNFMENKVDFMENKFDAILGNSIRSQDFMANTDLGLVSGLGDSHGFTTFSNPHSAICSPYGISLNGNTGLMLPFEASHVEDPNVVEMKPNKQFLTIDWQDQGCSEVGKDSFGYFAGLGSWSTGMMSGYGSSATNPLV